MSIRFFYPTYLCSSPSVKVMQRIINHTYKNLDYLSKRDKIYQNTKNI